MKNSLHNDMVAHQIPLGALEVVSKYHKMASEQLQDPKTLILEAHLRLVGLALYYQFGRAANKKFLMQVLFFSIKPINYAGIISQYIQVSLYL